MNVGRTQVHVVMTTMGVIAMVMLVPVMVLMIVMVAVLEQPSAEQINGQADNRNGDGLVVMDGSGGDQAFHRLIPVNARSDSTGLANQWQL